MHAKSLSYVGLFATLWTVTHQVHGILQARTLEQVAMSSSRGFSQPRIEPTSLISPASADGFFITNTICNTLRKTRQLLLKKLLVQAFGWHSDQFELKRNESKVSKQ